MKRTRRMLTTFALLAVGGVLITGCAGNTSQPSSESVTPPEAPPPASSSGTETATPAKPGEETAYRFFAKPDTGWVGDVMPFYENGTYNLFYLQDWRDGAPQFHPIHLFTTGNFTDYSWKKEVVPCGSLTAQDIAIGTGSILKGEDGRYHAFYTGHNYNYPSQGKPKEAMMHAVSDDMLAWTKLPEDTFTAPEGYETDDFRDPYVFWCEEAGEYWMLVSARKDGYGVVARFTSSDLSRWTVQEPLYAPQRYFMLECADLFKLGDYWYLFFSEFDFEHSTHYRVATSPYGPFTVPQYDMLDGRTFYAGKTGGNAQTRSLFGWIPTKNPAKDSGNWEWAGNMAALALSQNPDGSLNAAMPAQIGALFEPNAAPVGTPLSAQGSTEAANGTFTLNGGIESAVATFGTIADKMLIEADITVSDGAAEVGFLAGYTDDPALGFPLTINQKRQQLEYSSTTLDFANLVGNSGVVVPAPIAPGEKAHIQLLIDKDICVLYYNGKVALSARIYRLPGSSWGFYARQGTLAVEALTVSVLE